MFLAKRKNSSYFYVLYNDNGKRTKVSTKKTARGEAEKFLEDFRKQNDSIDLQKEIAEEAANKNPATVTLAGFKDEYIDYVKKFKAKSYIKSIEFIFKKFCEFTGETELNKINTRLIDQFITVTYSRSKSSAGLYYRTLKAAFTKAVQWEYIPENPFKKVKSPKPVKSFPAFITKEELQIIINKTQDQYLKDIFSTAFYTGMRLGELVNMKWNWIDLSKNTISVKCNYHFNTKSKKERIIPINETLKKVLLNQFPKVIDIKKNNYVFTRIEGIKLNEDFVSKQFKKAVRTGELNEEIHFHSLRHSFASKFSTKRCVIICY